MAQDETERGFLRGLQSYGDRDFSIYMRRAFAKSMGYSGDELSRPVVGIAYTHSRFNPCHRHFPELLDAVKRGVAAAGGLALEFPTISLHESTLAPNSMKFRNLMAMDTEEMIRAQPMDAVVLMGGCDKTVPAQLMGAASAGKPAIQLIGGPQMTSRYKDDRVGACTDCRKFWTQYRAGKLGKPEIEAVEGRLVTTAGTCAVMGTASTMAAIAEALGMTLPGTAAIPAVHADRLRAAEATGARAVALARSDLTPDKVITAGAIENATRVLLALGGSTNGVIHLAAIAGRVGLKLDLARLNALSDTTPVLAAVKPVGDEHYMEDFFAAGGIGAVLRELQPLLHLDCLTVTGETLGQRLAAEAGAYVDRRVIRPAAEPFEPQGGIVALFGSLAPDGAILKRSAATPELFERTGRAVVFSSLEDSGRPHRRSGARRDGGRFHRAAERRPAQRRGHAGGRLPADPEEAACRRREGHGAHLRRPHVRHRLRHHRAARGTRGGRGRPARPGAPGRPHPPQRQGAPARAAGGRGGAGAAAGSFDRHWNHGVRPRGSDTSPRLRQALPRDRHAGARRMRFRFSAFVGGRPRWRCQTLWV